MFYKNNILFDTKQSITNTINQNQDVWNNSYIQC